MTREEHKQIIQKMLGMVTPENQANASELLTQLSDDYEQTLTTSETLTANNATLTANNEKLRQVNADLFLKVGTTNKETHIQNNNNQNADNQQQEENTLTFDGLFNEKGELL